MLKLGATMTKRLPSDINQRQTAVDPTRSFIVQAPAGSGKTELLTDRILALLALVNQPEQIVAITFTRKAAAEMHARVLEKLALAQQPEPTDPGHHLESWRLARAALNRDASQQWHLLQHPARLSIRTIDAFCAALVRQMPWLSTLGGMPRICDDPMRYYMAAARQTIGMVQHSAVRTLLEHLDLNQQTACQALALMLSKRDQWLPLIHHGQSREDINQSLARFVQYDMHRLLQSLPPAWQSSLQPSAQKAAVNLAQDNDQPNPLAALVDWHTGTLTAAIDQLPAWRAIAKLVLTEANTLRQKINKNMGCPPKSEQKLGFDSWVNTFGGTGGSGWLDALVALRHAPNPELTDAQWLVLHAQLECLKLATATLWTAFSQTGEVDFIEVAQRANQALGSSEEPSDLLLKLDSQIQHILVDEFQDTSQSQIELLQKLIAGWQPGDGRTLFLVGDPMQSIYRFRKADVRLFLNVRDDGLSDAIDIESLQLNTNFRSQSAIVDWVNRTFAQCLPQHDDPSIGAISYAKSEPFLAATIEPAVQWHALISDQDEISRVVELAQAGWHDYPDAKHPVAILVRARKHIGDVMRILRSKGLPCRAVELVPLRERSVVVDLIQLARALSHEADRAAWVAVLRAKWCGLTLETLHHLLAGANLKRTVRSVMLRALQNPSAESNRLGASTDLADLTSSTQSQLIDDDQWQRWLSVSQIMCGAFERINLPFALKLEHTWRELEGDQVIDDVAELGDAQAVFEFVEKMAEHGTLDIDAAEAGLSRLFAQPEASGRAIEVMTMHKAKGLQFETVILMGLHRATKGDTAPLVRVDQLDDAIVFGPVKAFLEKEQDPISQYLGRLEARRSDYEVDRLLYVAATRAQSVLHLVAQVTLDQKTGDIKTPSATTLLSRLWPFCPQADLLAARNVLQRHHDQHPDHVAPHSSRAWIGPTLTRRQQPLSIKRTQAAIAHNPHGAAAWSADMSGERWVGTVVHAWLAAAVVKGVLPNWSSATFEIARPTITRQLGLSGMPVSMRHSATQEVIDILLAMLQHEKGRWLLSQTHARAEWALVDDEASVSVLDWAILNADGWLVVDYKTSRKGQDESLDAFATRMMARYQDQLERYCRYLQAIDGRTARAALYFPKDDIWLPWSPTSVLTTT
jgi:ATP-dependent exoDNAse (exonuclease V) beta subunit